jgi:hypothetical protein
MGLRPPTPDAAPVVLRVLAARETADLGVSEERGAQAAATLPRMHLEDVDVAGALPAPRQHQADRDAVALGDPADRPRPSWSGWTTAMSAPDAPGRPPP